MPKKYIKKIYIASIITNLILAGYVGLVFKFPVFMLTFTASFFSTFIIFRFWANYYTTKYSNEQATELYTKIFKAWLN